MIKDIIVKVNFILWRPIVFICMYMPYICYKFVRMCGKIVLRCLSMPRRSNNLHHLRWCLDSALYMTLNSENISCGQRETFFSLLCQQF